MQWLLSPINNRVQSLSFPSPSRASWAVSPLSYIPILLYFPTVFQWAQVAPALNRDRTAWPYVQPHNPLIVYSTCEYHNNMLGCLNLDRSEEHTSELQSQSNLVCRLLLEKKNKTES